MAGKLVIDQIEDSSTNVGSTTDMIKGSAKAWVNFNGTGTVAIRASYNVSSITDNGTGDYTINFATPLEDANYAVGGGATGVVTQARAVTVHVASNAALPPTLMTASACRVVYGGNGTVDGYISTFQAFR